MNKMDPPSPPETAKQEHLHPERAALKRRRSESISEDISVIKTNDDATECKKSAIQAGYWKDPFIQYFCAEAGRRDPEIHRGYFARVHSIRTVVDRFLKIAGPSSQIVNLGCGYDTLFWQLDAAEAPFARFVDVDFSSVTSKKIAHIMKPSGQALKQPLVRNGDKPRIEGRHSLRSGRYSLVAADLRQLNELFDVLTGDLCSLDPTAPTLFMCECVLVYMAVEQSEALIKRVAETYANAAFVSYGMVNLDDQFGRVMLDNLRERGISLAGIRACQSAESLEQRFTSNGWASASAITMQHIYEAHLPKQEVTRIEQLEMLDERELLVQLLQHYSITFANTADSVVTPENWYFSK